MTITASFAGVPVGDYESMRDWYERLLGRAPDMLPHDTEATWRPSEGGWIYVVADPERAGKALITVLVDDLAAELVEIAGRGIEPGPVEEIPGKALKAKISDPEGNRIMFGQPLGG
jgi:predicted enzyme related to lactoylglutathione lyase